MGQRPAGVGLRPHRGLTTFALSHVLFAVSTKDEQRSVFNLDTLSDKPLLVSIGAALAVTAASELRKLLLRRR